MQILELNDKILAYDINLQVAYALTILLVFVGIISLTIGLLSQQTINGNIKEKGSKLLKMCVLCFILILVLGTYITVYTLKFQSDSPQYKAVVTDIDEVKKQGYTIIEHIDDDLYIIEKKGE